VNINFYPETKLDSSWSEPSKIQENWKRFLQTIDDPKTGFFHITHKEELLNSCVEIFEKFQSRKNFIQVGIGGSSLGPEMLVSALGDGQKRFEFINNIDPDHISRQLTHLKPAECLFYFVSKSGSTAEMSAGMAIITNWLNEHGFTEKDYANFFVFATDPIQSHLLDLGKKWNVTCLEVPSNVGGRFSVLTPVGFLPALFAGIDPSELLRGANDSKKELLHTTLSENKLIKAANFIMALKDEGVVQTVLMPYSSRLRDLSFWFVQLWAESLGKKLKEGGETGLTPIPSYGATDQHSQVQLFMEGPRDKALIFVEVEKFEKDFSLKTDIDSPSLVKLAPYSLSQLMKAEFQGTLKAMEKNERPYIKLSLSTLDAYNLGQIILFLECLTVLTGRMLGINPFDQPGVEAGKVFAFQWLEGLSD
tara:strand:+ start:183909 stop:185168 length:1260 start_codon:yes stop_codon:yes gene_type:complete